MGFTVFYEGNLKKPDDLQGLFDTASGISDKYGWPYSVENGRMNIDIPDFEPFILHPQNGEVDGWVKYWGSDNEALMQLFELLREIKLKFQKLEVDDDYGVWHDYMAQFSKDEFPPFRELKDIELAEFAHGFYLPKGSTTIWGLGQPEEILMHMICKDLKDSYLKEILIHDKKA